MAVEAGGIGARLRAGREKHSLTILQVAERIHTDPRIVEAIEADNFPALGAPVYARGHIRHYAELVGESAGELTAMYANLSKVGQPDLTQIVKASSAADTNKLVFPALVVIAVFAVAGAVWWVSSLSKKKPQLSETHVVGDVQPGTVPSTDSGEAGAGQAPSESQGQTGSADRGGGAMSTQPGSVVSGGSSAGAQGRAGASTSSAGTAAQNRPTGGSSAATRSPGGSAGTTAPHLASGAASTPGTRTASAANSTPPARPQPATGSATPATNAGAVTAAPPTPRSKNQAQVTLRYSADSWTEVYDATGARLFYDVGSANSVQTVVGTPPLRVVLGNASGVAVEFNGHSMPITKLAHPDGSVQFSINRSGRVIRAKPVADGG